MEHLKDRIRAALQESMDELLEIRTALYQNPEVGGTESDAPARMVRSLRAHGFQVTEKFREIPGAFRAAYQSQRPGPVLGLMAEFDALPDIGHGCGHNLICTMALGAAYGLKSVVEDTGGTVIVYGTPGEENLCTKVRLTAEGAFDELDVAMMAHPNPVTHGSGGTLAIESLQIEFFGKSSHAGAAPEKGINALDAAVLFYQAMAMEKQYHPGTNVYGIINDGGEKASVIPDHTSLKFLNRAKTSAQLVQLRQMTLRCAQTAAQAAGCTCKVWNNEASNFNMVTNSALSERFNVHYEELGGGPIRLEDVAGSTDMGDVSHRVPSIHPWVGFGRPELRLHSAEFAEATVSPEADLLLFRAALALAFTGFDVLTDEKLLIRLKEEFARFKAEEEML